MTLIRFNDDSRLYSYVVAVDGGNAPNPYHGICTLAICKPAIRRTAQAGDVIVGLDSATRARGRIVYCMVVDESIPWSEYIKRCKNGDLPRGKIPKTSSDQGDCIWKNTQTPHDPLDSHSGHNFDFFEIDVRLGQNVLISRRFWYFGRGNQHFIQLGGELSALKAGRGHRSKSNHMLRQQFADFINRELSTRNLITPGRYGEPLTPPISTSSTKCTGIQKR